MKISPRCLALAAFLSAALLILPPSDAMDVMERIVSTQTQAIRREATEYQRKVAEANARAYMAAKLHTAKGASSSNSGKTSGTPAKTHKGDVSQDTRALKAKLPRYVAVDTVKDKRSAPGTTKDVMIWDTQSEALVGNYVYDVQKTPAVGSTAKFDTYSAEYVGTGL